MATDLRVVLVRPEISHNAGAIGRTCISMSVPHARSLNLANAASIARYEAYRQIR